MLKRTKGEFSMKKRYSRRAAHFMPSYKKSQALRYIADVYGELRDNPELRTPKNVYKAAYMAHRAKKYDNGGSLEMVCRELLWLLADRHEEIEANAHMTTEFSKHYNSYLVDGEWAHRRVKHLYYTDREKYIRLSVKIDATWNEIPF